MGAAEDVVSEPRNRGIHVVGQEVCHLVHENIVPGVVGEGLSLCRAGV